MGVIHSISLADSDPSILDILGKCLDFFALIPFYYFPIYLNDSWVTYTIPVGGMLNTSLLGKVRKYEAISLKQASSDNIPFLSETCPNYPMNPLDYWE